MILFLKKVFLLKPVNKANRLQIACFSDVTREHETGNKMVTPVKKQEVVHVVHITGRQFTTISGSLGTFCPPHHFRQNADDLLHFLGRGIAAQRETNQ